jgi:hypothetical protein
MTAVHSAPLCVSKIQICVVPKPPRQNAVSAVNDCRTGLLRSQRSFCERVAFHSLSTIGTTPAVCQTASKLPMQVPPCRKGAIGIRRTLSCRPSSKEPASEGTDDGADLILRHHFPVEIRGFVRDVVVEVFPADLARLAIPESGG